MADDTRAKDEAAEDARDAAIAHKRLAEIEAHPERMVAGERLDQWLAKVEEEDNG